MGDSSQREQRREWVKLMIRWSRRQAQGMVAVDEMLEVILIGGVNVRAREGHLANGMEGQGMELMTYIFLMLFCL
jgi:hypothetical protein